jgi:hypothetical protein
MTFSLIRFTLVCFVLSPSLIFAQVDLTVPRTLAPGVLHVFPSQIEARDSFSFPMPLPDLDPKVYAGNFSAKVQSLHGQTRDIIFFRNVWQYEFATLGLRQIRLAFRAPDGSTVNKHYWYMVYRVRDFGKSLSYEQVKQTATFEYIKHELKIDAAKSQRDLTPQRFNPQFELRGWVGNANGGYDQVAYRDQYLPEAAREIQKLEDPAQRLFNKLEIGDVEVPLATSESDPGVWGVAVWEGVDPNVNYVSVYVRGITNAYRLVVGADKTIELIHKTLQLNYWRPGDSAEQEKDFVDFGIPLVDRPEEQIAITRRYDLPGPQIRAFVVNELAVREIAVTEIDAGVDLDDFSSPVTKELDQGKLPESMVSALQISGTNVNSDTAVTTVIPSSMWQFQLDVDGKPQKWVLKFEPQYWEKQGKGIRFIKSLDHLWIYR